MGGEKKKKLLREQKCRLARWQVLSYKRMTTTTKKKSTEQESDAAMYNLLMVEKKKKKMFGMAECWFTMSPVSDAKVGRKQGVVGK